MHYRGTFTTCDLDTPHFAFRAKKMKLVNQKLAVTGPIHPEFEGVPIPIYLPFGFFPLSTGPPFGSYCRHSLPPMSSLVWALKTAVIIKCSTIILMYDEGRYLFLWRIPAQYNAYLQGKIPVPGIAYFQLPEQPHTERLRHQGIYFQ